MTIPIDPISARLDSHSNEEWEKIKEENEKLKKKLESKEYENGILQGKIKDLEKKLRT